MTWSGAGPLIGYTGEGVAFRAQALLTGDGAYEGLSALLDFDGDRFAGLVFKGDLPPMP